MNSPRTTPVPLTDEQVQAAFEEVEVLVLQSTNVRELDQAYQSLLNPERVGTRNARKLLETAGPVGTLALLLHGYESSDAAMRLVSARSFKRFTELVPSLAFHESFTEQFWLALAQQQEHILVQLEADIEALHSTTTADHQIAQATHLLLAVHKLIVSGTTGAVRTLLASA